MNRTYEIMFIVRPDVEEADLDKLIEGFQKNVTDGGGEIKSTEKMGRRRLAYTVRKFNDGFYVLLTIVAAGIKDANGQALDGNRDGIAGGNLVANIAKGSATILGA